MPTKKPARTRSRSIAPKDSPRGSSARSTVSGPSDTTQAPDLNDPFQRRSAATQAVAAAFPYNANKPLEHGAFATDPQAGQTAKPPDASATGSTLTEGNASAKLGDGEVRPGLNPANGPLDRVRVDSSGRVLTTNQGVPVADNQNSLKAGLRGPTLLEDFILREKITHFDHERIPERIVHARGSAAHGYFECYEPLGELTRASIFAEAGKRTPVFVRFSTVVGERGSTDTARDVRGFAVKFYTDEGNWDLVGNNIPVFFIQDAMKFPDLVHAAKPEPHHAMPQAATAHDTFWDFVSLMPESTHMLMWVMSDRAIPRSYRMMQGFGVHTFRLVNARGRVALRQVPLEPGGGHALARLGRGGEDRRRRPRLPSARPVGGHRGRRLPRVGARRADLHRGAGRDASASTCSTRPRSSPRSWCRSRRSDAWCSTATRTTSSPRPSRSPSAPRTSFPASTSRNDPLLAGRIHSYVDTQISRLGGPNFHEIPINAPVAQVHNNQRDGMHRQAITRGRVAYEPNSLGGGCPFQAGAAGFMSFPQPVDDDKVRGKPEKFADHYTQATLFWNSQTPIEKAHIIARLPLRADQGAGAGDPRACRGDARQRRPTSSREPVADGLGIPAAAPHAEGVEPRVKPEVSSSPALSLFARPATAASARGASRSSSPTVSTAATARPSTSADRSSAPCRVTSARGSARCRRRKVTRWRSRSRWRRCPRCCSTRSWCRVARSAAKMLGNVGQAIEFLKDQYRHANRSWRSARAPIFCRTPACRRPCRRVSRIPVCCCTPKACRRHGLSRFVEAIGAASPFRTRDGSARRLIERVARRSMRCQSEHQYQETNERAARKSYCCNRSNTRSAASRSTRPRSDARSTPS